MRIALIKARDSAEASRSVTRPIYSLYETMRGIGLDLAWIKAVLDNQQGKERKAFFSYRNIYGAMAHLITAEIATRYSG